MNQLAAGTNVLLLHLDGALPNLALMRAAAFWRERGAYVELRRIKSAAGMQRRLGEPNWEHVYGSLIFEKTQPLAHVAQAVYPGIHLGGTGWDVASSLAYLGIPEEGPIDYADYKNFKRSMGFAMRGCRLKCRFCVVPRKEGKARSAATISEIWRGDPYPREVLLLDNDFFGNPAWRDVIAELREGGYKVSFNQGINARSLTEENARAIGEVDVRDDGMKRRRIYTAWDGIGDEKRFMNGLRLLVKHGRLAPDSIMVYMLIGEDDAETHEERDYRRMKLREFGCRPYPMPFRRTPELVAFQRWVVQRHDKHVPWSEWWGRAGGEPRKLGKRRVTLPLFPEPQRCDECDPSFGCWSNPAACSKRPR